MIGYFRDLRLLPIAMVASACLLALTAADLLLDRDSAPTADAPGVIADAAVVHVTPGTAQPGDHQQSWAQQMFNFPDLKGSKPAPPDLALPSLLPQIASDKSNADIITGSVGETAGTKGDAKPKGDAGAATDKHAKDAKSAPPAKDPPPPPPDGRVIPNAGAPGPSPSERAILDRLSERRQELDKRARELDIREGLIAEAEKRIDARLAEIKEAKASLAVAVQQKNEAEAARFKGLVTMYQTMKPRDAAKIFDRLETGVLIEVASQINPRNMSEILAQMSPDAAQRLTVELANRATAVTKDANADLPKIDGRPTTQ
jgi:flagellar motility protein MotE (MotC chaperone)